MRPCGPRADRRSAFQAGASFLTVGVARCGAVGVWSPTRFAALWAACRPEVGVPSRCVISDGGCCTVWRRRGLEAYALCGPVGRVPTGGRRSKPVCHLRRWVLHGVAPPGFGGLRALRPCGPRADRRSAFQAGVSPSTVGVARRGAVRVWRPTRLRPCGPRCRPEVGVPSRCAVWLGGAGGLPWRGLDHGSGVQGSGVRPEGGKGCDKGHEGRGINTVPTQKCRACVAGTPGGATRGRPGTAPHQAGGCGPSLGRMFSGTARASVSMRSAMRWAGSRSCSMVQSAA